MNATKLSALKHQAAQAVTKWTQCKRMGDLGGAADWKSTYHMLLAGIRKLEA